MVFFLTGGNDSTNIACDTCKSIRNIREDNFQLFMIGIGKDFEESNFSNLCIEANGMEQLEYINPIT